MKSELQHFCQWFWYTEIGSFQLVVFFLAQLAVSPDFQEEYIPKTAILWYTTCEMFKI